MHSEYRGFKLIEDIDCDEDCRKIFHGIGTPSGEIKSLQWSPYEGVSTGNFQMMVDKNVVEVFCARKPQGQTSHNWTNDSAEEYLRGI